MNKPIRTLFASAIALLAIQMVSPQATAQFGGDRIKRPLNRPTVSPYLNLFRRGNSRSPILNYYGSVRPQQQFYQQDQQLSRGLEQVEDRNSNRNRWSNRQNSSQNSNNSFKRYRMSITGHRAGFMTIGGGSGGGDEGGGGGSFGQGDDEESSGNRFSGHSASFGRGNFGSSGQ